MPNGWYSGKDESNLAKHGVGFEAAECFEWSSALVRADVRQDFGEVRLGALGAIDGRLYFLLYTIRQNCIWIIGLRKANKKEVAYYEAETNTTDR